MNAGNLVILLKSVACALGHEVWQVGVAEVPAHDAIAVQVMGTDAGVIVLVAEDLQYATAYHLAVVAATADLLHTVVFVVIHHMPMEIKAGSQIEARVEGH